MYCLERCPRGHFKGNSCQLESCIREQLVGDEHTNVVQDDSGVNTQQLENDGQLGDCAQLTHTLSEATDSNLEVLSRQLFLRSRAERKFYLGNLFR